MAKYLDDKGLKTFTTKMKDYAEGKVNAVDKKVTSHIGNTSNPHGVTKEHVGLGNVTNDKQIPLSQKGATNGVATLGADGKLTSTQIPTTKTINGQSIFGSGNITVSTSLYEIVDALPTKNIDISKIYLVPATTTADKNNKTEYIYIGDPSKAYDATKWEKLGEEQKNATIETPGGSIVVDTAFDTSSSNPIANKTVALRLNTIEDTLNGKVAQEEYNTNKADVNSKLKALEDNTITVDTELKDSVHPVQNKAVNSAVQELNRNLNAKADDADLTTAKGRIETLESNSISKDDITLIPVTDGNGIASIVKENKKLVITQGKFVTSLVGYATTATMNAELAKKAEKEHTHSQYALTSALDKYALKSTLEDYALNSTLANYATQGWITEQKFAKTSAIPTKVSDLDNDSGFLTSQSLDGYVNDVNVTEVTNGNGIASISKNGSSLNVTQGAFLKADSIVAETGDSSTGRGIVDISIQGNKLHKKVGTFVTPGTLGTAIDSYASNKGYLTEDNLNEKLKETITIRLVSDKSASDTNLNGATVTVKSGDTTVSTQTWQGTPIKVEVPCDKEVTIEAAVVKMYMKPQVLKYVPSPLYNREVTFTYKALETGVLIIDKNDKLYKTTEEFLQSGLPTTDIVGALLVTDKVAIVIGDKSFDETKWSNKNGLIDGCTVNSNATIAAQDFAGAANTAAIMKANAGLNTAASMCNNYVFKNGKKGHLMSGGEAIEIGKNLDRINSVLRDMSGDILYENKSYWTSTQKGSDTVWGIVMGDSTLVEYYITLVGSNTLATNAAFPIYSLYD